MSYLVRRLSCMHFAPTVLQAQSIGIIPEDGRENIQHTTQVIPVRESLSGCSTHPINAHGTQVEGILLSAGKVDGISDGTISTSISSRSLVTTWGRSHGLPLDATLDAALEIAQSFASTMRTDINSCDLVMPGGFGMLGATRAQFQDVDGFFHRIRDLDQVKPRDLGMRLGATLASGGEVEDAFDGTISTGLSRRGLVRLGGQGHGLDDSGGCRGDEGRDAVVGAFDVDLGRREGSADGFKWDVDGAAGRMSMDRHVDLEQHLGG